AVDLPVLVVGADVDPVAAVDRAQHEVPAGEEGGEERALDRMVDPGRHQLEDPGLQDVDARVDGVGGDLGGVGLLEKAADGATENTASRMPARPSSSSW